MTPNTKKSGYPYPTWRVYWSIALTVLSMILALLLLYPDGFWLLQYLISTSAITAAIYILKTRFTFTRETENSQEPQTGRSAWKILGLVLLMLILIFFAPLILARFLPPYVWFILIISFTSGISIAEVFFYLHVR